MTLIRLREIEIDAFRGFPHLRKLPLDADAVIVEGTNGSGKTSLVDALCWVLTGQLARIERHRRHLNDEFIVSQYAKSTVATVVLRVSREEVDWTIRRTGSSKGSALILEGSDGAIHSSNAEGRLCEIFGFPDKRQFDDAVDRWVLRQDEVRAILEASPNELHERLKEILSLDVLDTFEESLETLATERSTRLKDATKAVADAERVVGVARARLEQLEARIRASSEMQPALSRLEEVVSSYQSHFQLTVDRANLGAFPAALAELRASYEGLRRGAESIRRSQGELALGSQPTAEQLAEARQKVAAAIAEAEIAAKASVALQTTYMEAERRATAIASLATAALPLLGDHCPVCSQPIDEAHVQELLRQTLAREGSPDLDAGRLGLEQAVKRHREADLAVIGAREAEQAVVSEIARREAIERSIGESWDAIESSAKTDYFRLPTIPSRELDNLESTLTAIVEIGQSMRAVVSASQLAVIGDLRSQAQTETHDANENLLRLRGELEAAAKQAKDASDLLKVTRQAIVQVVDRAMESVNPSFSEVYRRLAPHPTFTDLSFEHDYYRLKGRSMPVVVDPLWEVTANPAIVCSVGQLNVVALSYFLAFAMSTPNSPMPFVVLDDPLQSLDDVNALGFADFCRRIKLDRQVVITTHDRRFGALLRRKMTPRTNDETALLLTMGAWDREGPRVLHTWMHGADTMGATA